MAQVFASLLIEESLIGAGLVNPHDNDGLVLDPAHIHLNNVADNGSAIRELTGARLGIAYPSVGDSYGIH